MTLHPVPTEVLIEAQDGLRFHAGVLRVASEGILVRTDQRLPYGTAVQLTFAARTEPLCIHATVVAGGPAQLGFARASGGDGRASRALASWARGEAFSPQGTLPPPPVAPAVSVPPSQSLPPGLLPDLHRAGIVPRSRPSAAPASVPPSVPPMARPVAPEGPTGELDGDLGALLPPLHALLSEEEADALSSVIPPPRAGQSAMELPLTITPLPRRPDHRSPLPRPMFTPLPAPAYPAGAPTQQVGSHPPGGDPSASAPTAQMSAAGPYRSAPPPGIHSAPPPGPASPAPFAFGGPPVDIPLASLPPVPLPPDPSRGQFPFPPEAPTPSAKARPSRSPNEDDPEQQPTAQVKIDDLEL